MKHFKYDESKSFALNIVFLWPIYRTKQSIKEYTKSSLKSHPLWVTLYEVRSFMIRDVNVFRVFFEKRSFRYENDDEKSKTKRSFLKTIVFKKFVFSKWSSDLRINLIPITCRDNFNEGIKFYR